MSTNYRSSMGAGLPRYNMKVHTYTDKIFLITPIVLVLSLDSPVTKRFIQNVESEPRGKSFSRARNFLCVKLLSQLLSAFGLRTLSQAERHKVTREFVLPQFCRVELQIQIIPFISSC